MNKKDLETLKKEITALWEEHGVKLTPKKMKKIIASHEEWLKSGGKKLKLTDNEREMWEALTSHALRNEEKCKCSLILQNMAKKPEVDIITAATATGGVNKRIPDHNAIMRALADKKDVLFVDIDPSTGKSTELTKKELLNTLKSDVFALLEKQGFKTLTKHLKKTLECDGYSDAYTYELLTIIRLELEAEEGTPELAKIFGYKTQTLKDIFKELVEEE